MDQKRLDQISDILKSEEIFKNKQGLCLKYRLDEASMYPCFNAFFGKYIKGEITIKDFINSVINSKPVYDLNFSIEDIILEYLRVHLDPIEDLLDDKIETVLNQVRDVFIEINNIQYGAKNVSKELSDGQFDSFADPIYIIDEVINILDLKFNGEELRERFYDNITKFIKNIRNKFQTFDILIKTKKDGGIDLEKNVADKILDIIDDVKKEKENFLLTQKIEEKNVVMSKEIDKDNILDKVKDLKKQDIENGKDLVKEYSLGDNNYHIFEGSIEEMYLKQIKSKEESYGDVNLSKIKDYSKSRLVGPIEELALLSVRDFRNLSSNVKERISIIERKIKVLESYSTRKKILGIKAWLGSEVCSVYKDMIDESVRYGNMSRIINMRKERGELFLTEEEVEEIAELNRTLRI